MKRKRLLAAIMGFWGGKFILICPLEHPIIDIWNNRIQNGRVSVKRSVFEAWSSKIAWYFYAGISAGSNGNFGGKTGRISDCRVCSLWKIVSVSHTSSYILCKIKTLSKLAWCFRPKVEMLKSVKYSRIWRFRFFRFCGYWMYWLINYSMRVDAGVRVRIFSKCRNIEIF